MIGVLQDILIDPEFVNMQSDFCLKNCGACTTVFCFACLYAKNIADSDCSVDDGEQRCSRT